MTSAPSSTPRTARARPGDEVGTLRPGSSPAGRDRATPPQPTEPAPRPYEGARPTQLDGDTIGLSLPPDDALLLVIEAAHQLGDIAYLDPSNGLVEVLVEFVGAPTASLLLTLQGRATGITEVMCTVEPLSGGELPPNDAVTRLLVETLRGCAEPSSET